MSYRLSTILIVLSLAMAVWAQQPTVPQAIVYRQGRVNTVSVSALQQNPNNATDLKWNTIVEVPNLDKMFNLASSAVVRSSNTIYVLTVSPDSKQLLTQITAWPLGAAQPSRTFSYPNRRLMMLAYNPFQKRLSVIEIGADSKASFCVVDPLGNLSCVPYPQLDYSSYPLIPAYFEAPNDSFAFAALSINGAGSLTLWVDKLDEKGFPGARLWGPDAVRRLNWQETAFCAASSSGSQKIFCSIVDNRPWKPRTCSIVQLKLPLPARYGEATWATLPSDFWFPCGIGERATYYPPVIDYDSEAETIWTLFSAPNNGKILGQFSAQTGKLSSQWYAPVFGDEAARPMAANIKP